MAKRLPLILILWLFTDVYFFQAVKVLTENPLIHWAYRLIDLIIIGGIASLFFLRRGEKFAQLIITGLMALMLLIFVPRLFSLPVLLVEDITRLFRGFPPRAFWVSELTMAVAAVIFLVVVFGITRGKHYYRVRRETLYFPDLPEAFDGFTITQLSDIHSGSFSNAAGVQKGLDLVNAQASDVILFTGDLVNNKASEMDRWIPAFAGLKAQYGKFSVLGNHDYGDYVRWDSETDKHNNLIRLKQVHADIGFKLLLNQSVSIEKAGQAINLVGVENWGKGGFHKYGDLDKATAGLPDNSFNILLSHDPSHWDAVTLGHHQHIHLTLAGHTHGMQFGIEFLGFKWSPIKYVYKQWAGLYEQAGKYLYVNRGFGFLGLKGRIGMWPEIAVITLKRKAQ
ncbi:metallophosphoesterase [Mucilaginibacter sp. JRF]|uniref:metallophosphoesterase n=1 Tax=Mucilaginibacter sp. JRF TaxID=2780088 RepID=UPI001880F2AE|nr:metallophosphoesterase [Mucilaginibacter sp. JRF]MBE9583492.1 metallophosphoesterase [Mucilaginibacter sp. JRF]